VWIYPIDFEAVAKACGAAGFTIERAEDAADVLRRALEHPGPAVVQAVVDASEPPLPGNISAEQALRFAEAIMKGEDNGWEIIKAVIKDKVREVL